MDACIGPAEAVARVSSSPERSENNGKTFLERQSLDINRLSLLERRKVPSHVNRIKRAKVLCASHVNRLSLLERRKDPSVTFLERCQETESDDPAQGVVIAGSRASLVGREPNIAILLSLLRIFLVHFIGVSQLRASARPERCVY